MKPIAAFLLDYFQPALGTSGHVGEANICCITRVAHVGKEGTHVAGLKLRPCDPELAHSGLHGGSVIPQCLRPGEWVFHSCGKFQERRLIIARRATMAADTGPGLKKLLAASYITAVVG